MKQILFFLLFLLPALAFAQWPAAPNKMRLGNQTTGDGLIYRSDSLPNYTPTSRNNAWFHFDTIAKKLYFHEGGTWQEFTSGSGGIDSTQANNGLTMSGDTVQLGGTLTKNTTIDTDGKILRFQDAGGYPDFYFEDEYAVISSDINTFLDVGSTAGQLQVQGVAFVKVASADRVELQALNELRFDADSIVIEAILPAGTGSDSVLVRNAATGRVKLVAPGAGGNGLFDATNEGDTIRVENARLPDTGLNMLGNENGLNINFDSGSNYAFSESGFYYNSIVGSVFSFEIDAIAATVIDAGLLLSADEMSIANNNMGISGDSVGINITSAGNTEIQALNELRFDADSIVIEALLPTGTASDSVLVRDAGTQRLKLVAQGGSGTWLKPELEADSVVINSAANTLAFNITNAADPAISPTIRIQMPDSAEDQTATGIEMRDTVNHIYMRDLYNGSFIREANTGMTFRTADTAQTIRLQSGIGYAQMTGGIDGNLRIVNGYGKGAKLRLTDYTNGGGYVQVAAPDTVSAAWTLTLPAAAPTDGQVLTAVGTSGATEWATGGGGGISGSGTTGTIPVWAGATALGDSPLTVSSGNVTATGTGAFSVPVGTTAQQPGTPTAGMTRYNSTNGAMEYRGASAWEVPVKSSTGTGLGTAGGVFYADAAGRAAADEPLIYEYATKRLLVNQTTSQGVLEGGIEITSLGNPAYLITYNNAAGASSTWQQLRSRGTVASPLAVQANDALGGIVAGGYSGAGFPETNTAFIQVYAAENWTTSNRGSYIAFAVTANGTGTRTERMRVNQNGFIGIGNTAPQRTLHVTGEVRITDLTTDAPTRFVGADADGDLGQITVGNGLSVSSSVASFNRGAPVTKTGDFTVAATENWLIVNNASANTTVTLPTASTNTGRELMLKNLSASFTVISNASNVVPIDGTAAGTAILPATAGAWATLVSDGTNWIIMQQ